MSQTRYKHPTQRHSHKPHEAASKEVKHSASFWKAWVDKDIRSRDVPFDYKRTPELRFSPHLISGWLGQADRLHESQVPRLKMLPVEQQETINTIFTELNFFRMIAQLTRILCPIKVLWSNPKQNRAWFPCSLVPPPCHPAVFGAKHRHVGQGLNHPNLFHSSLSTSVELKLLL